MKKWKSVLFLTALVLVSALFFSSIPVSANESSGHRKALSEARKDLEQRLLPLAGAGFVGIAHSESEQQIVIFVENEQAKPVLPRSFEDYTVRTEITGKIQALSTQFAEPVTGVSEGRQGKVRPLVGGTSLSAYVTEMYYAGTLGMVTYDDKVLSNAHVIAMELGTYDFLNTGTPIVQP